MKRAAFAIGLGLGLLALASAQPAEPPGLFVLGVDGMDPVILQRLMDEGSMPNFSALSRQGGFVELQTSTPPQSPVAWSNFITGAGPGQHGLFDFIHRDPATYQPVSSASALPTEVATTLDLFGLHIPLSGGEVSNNRGATAFWELLQQDGIPTEVYRIPGNYPPTPTEASVLSGMGTVDLRGGFGTYTWYTDRPPTVEHPRGEIALVNLLDTDLNGTVDTLNSALKGPPDMLHIEPGSEPRAEQYLTGPLGGYIDEQAPVLLLEVDGQRVVLQEGEWSEWIEVRFQGLPLGLMSIEGTVRFYAKSLRPHFQLYASPINISAASPAQPIATPDDFASQLQEKIGHFYTQGMPEETQALKDGLFDDDDYQSQVQLVQQDTQAMLSLTLDRIKPGQMTFFYVSDIDLQCHMLWRHHDPKSTPEPEVEGEAEVTNHPAWEASSAAKHAGDIEAYYKSVDALLGEVRARLSKDTLLLVMSDHGFQPYTRKVHLNTWLKDNGYLVLKDGKTTGSIAKGDVDWSKTRAYGLGFNGLYINQKGREAHGLVDAQDSAALTEEIAAKLLTWSDPQRQQRVVLRADTPAQVYNGGRVNEAPDLIVGYDKHYGCSDESTLGEVGEQQLQDNTSRWSGSHLMAPEVVPGVLLSNRPLSATASSPNLTDITATILHHYNVSPVDGMQGHTLF